MISLVISTFGRRFELTRLLRSLASQTNPDFEVIIVDQNPPGFLDSVLERKPPSLDVRVFRSGRGVSRGRNLGLRHARGSLVGFPDDDCWYGQDVCRQVAKFFSSHPDVDFLTGRTIGPDGRTLTGEFRTESGLVRDDDAFRVGNANTFFVRRQAALLVGGFAEELGPGVQDAPQAGEDVDFLVRCVRSEVHAEYKRDFTIFHDRVGEERTRKTVNRTKSYSIAFGHIIRRHFGIGYLSYRLCRSIGGALLNVVQGDFWNSRIRITWARGMLQGFLMRP